MNRGMLLLATVLALSAAACGDADAPSAPVTTGGVRVVTIDATDVDALAPNKSFQIDVRPADVYYLLDPSRGVIDYDKMVVLSADGSETSMGTWLHERSVEQGIDLTVGGKAEIALGSFELFNVIFEAFRDMSCDACRTAKDQAAYCHDAQCWNVGEASGSSGLPDDDDYVPPKDGDPMP
jgi:hypothetical protein